MYPALPPATGRVVAIPVALGYCAAVVKELGLSAALMLVALPDALQHAQPERSAAWETWLAPVRAYLECRDIPTLLPLDVAQLGAIYAGGTQDAGAVTAPGFRDHLRRVGYFWWQGEAPLDPSNDWPGLSLLLGATIDTALVRWGQQPPPSSPLAALSTAAYHRLATTALTAFAAALTTHAGIPCACTRLERQLTLHIPACPLCCTQPHPCPVWVGVVDGLLAWLHQGMEPSVVVNEALTRNHTIVLDLIADVGV